MGRKKQNNVVLYMRVPSELKDELKQLVKTRINEKKAERPQSLPNRQKEKRLVYVPILKRLEF